MPKLGPFIIQSKKLLWLYVNLTEEYQPLVSSVLWANFDDSAEAMPVNFHAKQIENSAYNAYEPETRRYFVLIITKNHELLRLRPIDHDLFMHTNSSAIPKVFLEIHARYGWMYTKRPKLQEKLLANYYELRNNLTQSNTSNSNIQTIIDNQFAEHKTISVSSWEEERNSLLFDIPTTDEHLAKKGFYFVLLGLKKLCNSKGEYENALKLITQAKSIPAIESNSSLSVEVKNEACNLLRFFYDLDIHYNYKHETIDIDFESYYLAMQRALYREDSSIKLEDCITYKQSIEIRKNFNWKSSINIDHEEIGRILFLCRASKDYLYLNNIDVEHDYISEYYADDHQNIRKLLQYVKDMQANLEYT